ncbi:MAG: preprotein translocase subunit SecA, partial [Candidatus Saccharibacteria bacterium]|nr:preprotein translocase subunit SecA [Candidatus Saccharibacteria bacterium]
NKDFKENFKRVFDLDEDLIDSIGLMRKEKDRYKLALAAVEEMYNDKELEFGEETMRKIEREVYLNVLDTLWMQHLENMQHLREGIHWRSVGQRDPLVEYRSESQKLFDGLQRTLREEVMHILLSIKQQDVAEVSDDKYDTELTKMAESATEKGVNEISAGEKNMDNEFSKDEHGITKDTPKTPAAMRTGGKNTNKNAKRNAARKNKKKARQNKKKGRR